MCCYLRQTNKLSYNYQTLAFNCQGDDRTHEPEEKKGTDSGSEDDSISDSDEVDFQPEQIDQNDESKSERENDVGTVEDGAPAAFGWGPASKVGLAVVKAKKVKVKADRTVVARLDKLEESLSNLKESHSTGQPTPATKEIELSDETVAELTARMHAVESFLDGFVREENDCVHVEVDDESQQESVEEITSGSAEKDGGEDEIESEVRHGVEEEIESVERKNADEEAAPIQPNSDEDDSVLISSEPTEALAKEEDPNSDDGSSDAAGNIEPRRMPSFDSSQFVRRGSLLSHLKERDDRTGLSIEDLAQQIIELQQQMQEQGAGPQSIDSEDIQKQVSELSEGLLKQVAELEVSVSEKVSSADFEARLEDIRRSISSSHDPVDTSDDVVSAVSNPITANADELAKVRSQILEKISTLEEAKMDKESFERQLAQMESDLKALLGQEVVKQQLVISTNAEKAESGFVDIKSILDAQNDAIMQLHGESPVSSDTEATLNGDDVNARIQQATDALRESLEEKLDELRSIEDEMDGFASKLAEKPSQDQIDSMVHDLEKRLGQDEALQVILTNVKMGMFNFCGCFLSLLHLIFSFCILCMTTCSVQLFTFLLEMKQRMTRSEVLDLVRQSFKEARLGIQNTKDTLMVGRISYCLGCSQPFPAGVNGVRAPKMNHDSLPRATGLISNSTLYGTGSRKSLRALRSAPQRPRPRSAIVGKFSSSSELIRVVRNTANSR